MGCEDFICGVGGESIAASIRQRFPRVKESKNAEAAGALLLPPPCVLSFLSG